jgi:hypothetical protein
MQETKNLTQTPPLHKTSVIPSAFVLKKCTCCNLELPKTEEYFLLKPKRKNYKWKVNEIYRSNCKKCWYQKTSEQRIIKKCNELGIERFEWDEWKRKNMLKNPIFQFKDERLKDFKRPLRARILKKIREENYVFTTIENYYKECTENRSQARRIYDYKQKVLNSEIIKNEMPDYYIANRLKKPINELPKEIIETKRLLLKIKRELKNKNYGS